jgi:hypothetical protein
MSLNQGNINRHTFGYNGRSPNHPQLRKNTNSREDLSSDDPEMRSFNSINGYLKKKQRSATIHIRPSQIIKGERAGVIMEEEDHFQQ